jgi:tripartite-type tricarboxylate transporter receptor subunit TctC
VEHMMMNAIVRKACSAMLLALMACNFAWSQGYPERPINFIVPWPAGGGTDIAMRALADVVAKQLNARFVIENKPGAAGTIGPASMLNARPDGYTIAQMPITMLRYPHMQKVNWDPFKDFTWIVGITGYSFGVVVRADSPWKTWKEFIAYAKANPDKITYGSPGAGSSLHMTMQEIAAKDGIQWIHVPFKGNADATASLMGGHITASADSFGWAEHIQSGRFRLLVSWGAERTKRWPDVPTLKELGYNIVSNSPYGIAGPKGMDPKHVKILHDAFKKAIEDPGYQKVLERLDQENYYLSTEDYARRVKIWYDEEKANVERVGLSLKP